MTAFLCVGLALAGLVIPGWRLARAARLPAPWLVALPLSLVLLFHAIFWAHAAGAHLTFAKVAVVLAAVTALVDLVARYVARRSPVTELSPDPAPGSAAGQVRRWPLGLAALVGGLLVLRCLLEPLTGFDTYFRWDFLAVQVLKTGRYDYYPPVAPSDFHAYFYVDGIPPLVSFAYWFLYAAAGRHVPQLTALFVAAQYAWTLAGVYHLTLPLGGRRGAWLAVATLATSVLYFQSLAMSQETGLTALGMVSMLYLCTAAPRTLTACAMAGACAAMAALSREYALAFLAVGAVALALSHSWRTELRRRRATAVAVFLGVAILLSAPWYVRNTIKTGNPIYSLRVGLLPVNPMYDHMMQSFRGMFGVSQWGADGLWKMFLHLLVRGPVAWTAGVMGAVLMARRRPDLLLGVALTIALWLLSAGYTTGGPFYSARVLTPAIALLSVAAGHLLARAWDRTSLRRVATVVFTASTVYTVLCAWTYPDEPSDLPRGQWLSAAFRTGPEPPVLTADATATALRGLVPPTWRILSPNPYLFRALLPYGYSVVPPWSSETAFLMDPAVHSDDARRRLLGLGIRVIDFDRSNVHTIYQARDMPSDLYRNPTGWAPLLHNAHDEFYRLLPPEPATRPDAGGTPR